MSSERITSEFTAESTAMDVVAGLDLHGKRIIVTGGSSGIGIETARALASAGAELTLAVRDTEAGHGVANKINAELGDERVSVAPLQLAEPSSIGAFARAWGGTPLHVLINNAGVMATPFGRTSDGWETQFGTNHLGHFALANALHPALASAGGARIVSVSSRGHLRSPVIFDDINFTERSYDPWLAYGQSKTANVLFAVGATERWSADGITTNALHPGAILTNLSRHVPAETLLELRSRMTTPPKTPEQGAATSVFVATSALLDGVGGRYFEDSNQAVPHTQGQDEFGVAAYALDPEAATRLWELSIRTLHP
ncbi:MAG TPA: SDR family NAD(P)-dependent oxidoreductase [Pseudonocardia sp.]|jgi:NAD(P)-dependent dehydrogenase (short-subunit alcohol dehydrogenase family)